MALAPLDLQASGLALAGARRLELGHQRRLVELGDGAQLRGDIEQVYDDIFSGKRAVSFPLSPPAGALSDPLMVRTLEAIERHHLTIAAAHAVMRAQMMVRVGERFTAQRAATKRGTQCRRARHGSLSSKTVAFGCTRMMISKVAKRPST